MQFKVDFPFASDIKLSYKTPVLSIGSCFAESIAQKLEENRFDVYTNPNGILYNPLSIAAVISQVNSLASPDSDSIFFYNELWHSWNHHGRFSNSSKEELIDNIQRQTIRLQNILSARSITILVTLGTATVFFNNNKPVANCHKLPKASFTQRRLSVNEIVAAFTPIIEQYASHQFVFTVSPVRYIKYGLIDSNRDKSVLLLAVEELVKNHKNASYFPSYEIVNDELRDYRYFANDLVHPNALAIDYVWERLVQALFDEETMSMYADWQKVHALLNHKILHPSTNATRQFETKRNQMVDAFNQRYFK